MKSYDELHMTISTILVKRISKGRELSPKQWCNMMKTQIEPVAQMIADVAEAQQIISDKEKLDFAPLESAPSAPTQASQ